MIIVKMQGGLGNQLFQYATGLAVSAATGMELKLDLTWYADVPEGVTHRKFELDGFKITAGIASPAEIRRICRTGFSPLITLLGKLGRGRTQIFLERSLTYDPSIMHIQGPAYLNGYWQSEKYFRHLRTVLLEEFSLIEDLSSLATPPSRPRCVAVHVRRGDYVSNPAVNNIHGSCPIDYYCQAARIIRERVPGAEFRIFSDDPEWAAANLLCF